MERDSEDSKVEENEENDFYGAQRYGYRYGGRRPGAYCYGPGPHRSGQGHASATHPTYSHPEDICYKFYPRAAATVPPHRSPDCSIGYRRKEDAIRIIQNFEKLPFARKVKLPLEHYFSAKGLLNPAAENLSGHLTTVLPPANHDPTITHVVLKGPLNSNVQPNQVLKRPTAESPTYVAPPRSIHDGSLDPLLKAVQVEDSDETIYATALTNYKVEGWISMSPNNATEVTMILDTGAGPNTLAIRALRDG